MYLEAKILKERKEMKQLSWKMKNTKLKIQLLDHQFKVGDKINRTSVPLKNKELLSLVSLVICFLRGTIIRSDENIQYMGSNQCSILCISATEDRSYIPRGARDLGCTEESVDR